MFYATIKSIHSYTIHFMLIYVDVDVIPYGVKIMISFLMSSREQGELSH